MVPMTSVSFKRENRGMLGARMWAVTVKLKKEKIKLKDGETKELKIEPGKYKVVFIARRGFNKMKLVSRLKFLAGEKIGYKYGIDKGKIYYEVWDLEGVEA